MPKTLLDIQIEMRALEQQVQSVANNIAALHDDLENLKADKSVAVDFEEIKKLAKKFHFAPHGLLKAEQDEYTKLLYIKNLLCLVQVNLQNDAIIDQLVFIQWLHTQAHLTIALDDLLRDVMNTDIDDFAEMTKTLSVKHKESLLLDAMIVVNIHGTATNQQLAYIASLAEIFKIGKDEVKILAVISKAILRQTFTFVSKNDLPNIFRYFFLYKQYITEFHIKYLYKNARMKVVNGIYNETFKWLVPQKSYVEKGQNIALFKDTNWGNTLIIEAEASGFLFRFSKNSIKYAVISIEDDNLKDIMKWVSEVQ